MKMRGKVSKALRKKAAELEAPYKLIKKVYKGALQSGVAKAAWKKRGLQ